MGFIMQIRNNESGEIRELPAPWAWSGDVGWESYYSNGNGQCDCNREMWFRKAGNEKVEFGDTRCGDGGFSIRILSMDKVKCYYDQGWELDE